nr:hypothetical protein [Tanacetum cinerariifolium]
DPPAGVAATAAMVVERQWCGCGDDGAGYGEEVVMMCCGGEGGSGGGGAWRRRW